MTLRSNFSLSAGVVEKFRSYIDDIFEAEDSVPAEPTSDSLDELYEFFSRSTTDWSRPILNTRVVSKLTSIVDQIARPTKRIRRDVVSHSPSAADREGLSSVEPQQLLRIIKILERSIISGEDINPFAGPVVKLADGATASVGDDTNGKSPAKGKKGKNVKTPEGRQTRSKSRTPVEPDGMDLGEDKVVDSEKVEHALDLAKESVLAADACLALLGSDQLPKQASPIKNQRSINANLSHSCILKN